MRLLLDTHAIIWLFEGSTSLPAAAFDILISDDVEVLVSSASAWEIATKFRLGKLPAAANLVHDFSESIAKVGFVEFPLSFDHAIRAGLLPLHHKDPFDRMLAAQCQAESIPIISNDRVFEFYGVRRIW